MKPAHSALSRRRVLQGGALTVAFALGGSLEILAQGAEPAKTLDANAVDAYLTINANGTVTLYSGKVDLGQGLRIALPQIAAEELGIGVDKIRLVEGDTALTPDQGRTSGSTGIQRGGMQIRRAAATARKALIDLAAKQMNVAADDLTTTDGSVRPRFGGAGKSFAAVIGNGRFDVKLDPKAPLKNPADYTIVGRSLPRPDVRAKCTGGMKFVHDFKLPGMLHARVVRPPAIGARLISADETSIAAFPRARVLRIKDFLAVVAEDEWTAMRAHDALRAQWSEWDGLPEQAKFADELRQDASITEQVLVDKGKAPETLPAGAKRLSATYFWPMQSHASIGPSCAVADVRSDAATIWTASQGTHGNQATFARFLKLSPEKVRLIYMDGAGCYGMNGHEDAAADAAIVSQAIGKPVRVQWSRADEHGFDPKGPAQLLDISGAVGADGRILDWRTDVWLPQTTKGLPYIPLLGPLAAGLDDVNGLNTGLISQNTDPSYAADKIQVVAHWLKTAPLRPAPLRSPGKPANCFAVESFTDELAAAARMDPVEFRLRGLSDPRSIAVLKRAAELAGWQPRPSPGSDKGSEIARGRGIAHVHYKHDETYVATVIEIAVERASGRINVERVVCAHDCGQIINPDGVRAQVEGCIIQTLSRVLHEEVMFDRSRVTSLDWASYPILRFSEVPKIEIALIDRPIERPFGAGEAACAPIGAALGNAVFDATGARMRTIPITPVRLAAALTDHRSG